MITCGSRKAVFAAILVSVVVNKGITDFNNIDSFIMEEWNLLNKQGIIPPKPIK